MHLSRFVFVLMTLTGTSTLSYAQKPATDRTEKIQVGKLSGRLVDDQKKPIAYATVTLLRADSTIVNGDLSKDDGSFTIEPTGIGKFSLKITGIGLTSKTISNIEITATTSDKKLGSITLTSTSKTLKEVQVTGEKAMMEMAVDKKVFNVEKNITSAGGSATDVLQNVPSVSVDMDGNISLRGKGDVTILIDGKPATLLGGDVTAALQSLPAASIQNVEVITNPSSRYDAQGVSGIINIITKKDRKMGFNGSATVGAGTRDKYNGSLNLNMRNNKWNVFFNSSYKLNRNYQRGTIERTNLNDDGHYLTNEDNMRTFGGFFNTLGAEYTLNDKNSFTLTQNLNRMQWGNKGNSIYRIFSGSDVDTMQRRYSDNLGGPLSSSTSLDYKHKFAKPRQELSANVTFAYMKVEREQNYSTSQYTGDELQLSPAILQSAPGGGSNTTLNGQVDFTTPFLNKTAKLDAGVKTQLLWFDSKNTPTIDTGDGPMLDSRLLVDYDYTQDIHAAYVNVSDQFKNLSYQLGLRGEYAIYEGSLKNFSSNVYTYDYFGLFPSAFVSYKMRKEQSVYLNYTRRTNRPHFMQLMPFLDLSNLQETSVGNPDLLPEFIHNVEFSYNKQFKKGHNIIISTYYQYTRDLIERYREAYANGTSFSKPYNLDHGVTYGVEAIAKIQPHPIVDFTASGNFFRNEIDGTNIDSTLKMTGYSWFSKLNMNVRLPYGFAFQMNGNYEAPKVVAQGKLENVYWLDMALRKNLWNNKATLVFNVSDIFNTRKYTTNYDFGSSVQSIYKDRETRIGNVTFTYRFGRSDAKNGQGARRKTQNAPVPEKDRNNLRNDDNSDQGGF